MRVLPAKRNNVLAKNLQQLVEIASFSWERGVEPVANSARKHVTIHPTITEIAEIIGHELDDGISPIAYFVGRRLKHFYLYTRKNRSCKLRMGTFTVRQMLMGSML